MARLRELVALAGLVGLSGDIGLAQAPTTMTPSSNPESIPGGTLLLVAYAFAWAVVLLYVFMVWRRSGRIERELADVTAKLNARSSGTR
jgi:CcmD family protein